MQHAESTVSINRPAAEVFDYLAEGSHNRDWRTGVIEISRTSETAGQGATYRQVLAGPGGRRIPGDYRVTVYEPGRRLGFEVTAGPVRPTGLFQLSELGPAETRVDFALDVQPTGLMRLMTPMVAKQMQREVAQLAHLKTILEGK
jgi:uncharacterized protein YndB with AHSA1/START domain